MFIRNCYIPTAVPKDDFSFDRASPYMRIKSYQISLRPIKNWRRGLHVFSSHNMWMGYKMWHKKRLWLNKRGMNTSVFNTMSWRLSISVSEGWVYPTVSSLLFTSRLNGIDVKHEDPPPVDLIIRYIAKISLKQIMTQNSSTLSSPFPEIQIFPASINLYKFENTCEGMCENKKLNELVFKGLG